MSRPGIYWTWDRRLAEKIMAMLAVRGIKFGTGRQNIMQKIAKAIRKEATEKPNGGAK